jgi:hypothetical protein
MNEAEVLVGDEPPDQPDRVRVTSRRAALKGKLDDPDAGVLTPLGEAARRRENDWVNGPGAKSVGEPEADEGGSRMGGLADVEHPPHGRSAHDPPSSRARRNSSM